MVGGARENRKGKGDESDWKLEERKGSTNDEIKGEILKYRGETVIERIHKIYKLLWK